jgi:alpha-N-arabinofuranosidase
MKATEIHKRLIVQIVALCFVMPQTMNAQQNTITLNPEKATTIINRNIYGHFAEHLGHCIYEGIWVGEKSSVPNTRGIRNDVVKALRDIAIPNLRWPGGCFADEYHWENGIGAAVTRPAMVNTNWGNVTEDNSFGTHEFLDLCSQLGCEPVITGNLGSGSVEEMSKWVEYINSDNKSPTTDLRRKNGKEKGWNVHYWGLGNESWGCGGAMRPEYYFDQMMHYSNFCRNYTSTELYRIAVGPNNDDYNWTETLMKLWSEKPDWDKRLMSGISLHYYTICHTWDNKGSATEFNETDWFATLSATLKMNELITRHTEIMDKYDPEKKIGLVVDEWGNWFNTEPGTHPAFLFQQNTLRDAMVAALNLNIFNNHADRVVMANIAQMVNVLQSVILTRDQQIVLTPTYYVFKMYKAHQNAKLIPISVSGTDYILSGQKITALSASASKDSNGKIHITIVNTDPVNSNTVTINLSQSDIQNITAECLTAGKMNAYNDFGQEAVVKPVPFNAFKISGNGIELKMPSKSIISLEIVP